MTSKISQININTYSILCSQFTTDADALILNFLASHLKFDLPDKPPTEEEGADSSDKGSCIYHVHSTVVAYKGSNGLLALGSWVA